MRRKKGDGEGGTMLPDVGKESQICQVVSPIALCFLCLSVLRVEAKKKERRSLLLTSPTTSISTGRRERTEGHALLAFLRQVVPSKVTFSFPR